MIRLKVKSIAKVKGYSQSRLARRSNIDAGTMRRIYQNPHTSITLPLLDRIATTLGVDASELIESVPNDAPVQDSPPGAENNEE